MHADILVSMLSEHLFLEHEHTSRAECDCIIVDHHQAIQQPEDHDLRPPALSLAHPGHRTSQSQTEYGCRQQALNTAELKSCSDIQTKNTKQIICTATLRRHIANFQDLQAALQDSVPPGSPSSSSFLPPARSKGGAVVDCCAAARATAACSCDEMQ